MTEATLTQEIVQSIIDQTLMGSLIYIGLMLACSILATWFIARIQKNAEIKEVTANLDEIKEQLKEQTAVTEEVKQQIELDHWRQKEIELVRRQKLEEALLLVNESLDRLMVFYMRALHVETLNDSEVSLYTKLDHARVLFDLYFIDLITEFDDFDCYYRDIVNLILDETQAIKDRFYRSVPPTGQSFELFSTEYQKASKFDGRFTEKYKVLDEAKWKLIKNSAELAAKLNS